MNDGTWNAGPPESELVIYSVALFRFNDYRRRQFLSVYSHVVISLTRHHLTKLQRIQSRPQAPAYLIELTVPTNGRSIEIRAAENFRDCSFQETNE
ncbi:hypothetical protein [Pseudomonas sp. GM41(2012)]|uniref:hypothetical protein n=1 Tax=Pseudomonas sp. (strain GM41(2012)) TaxID=1144708 RepID=UPI0012375466|nr:hypothetical protein [Pseudomonas sp. GM41(2012)]